MPKMAWFSPVTDPRRVPLPSYLSSLTLHPIHNYVAKRRWRDSASVPYRILVGDFPPSPVAN
jgi:hypothetical protein